MSAAADPIEDAQQAVWQAMQLIGCIGEAFRDGNRPDDIDIFDACKGVNRLLNELHSNLDPAGFREQVLASEAESEAPEMLNG